MPIISTDRMPHERHPPQVQLFADVDHVLGIARESRIPPSLHADRSDLGSRTDVAEQHDLVAIGQGRARSDAMFPAASESVRQHHHRAIRTAGHYDIVPAAYIHTAHPATNANGTHSPVTIYITWQDSQPRRRETPASAPLRADAATPRVNEGRRSNSASQLCCWPPWSASSVVSATWSAGGASALTLGAEVREIASPCSS